MAFLDVGGCRLFHTDEGAGEPLVLVHGWTCDSQDWSWMVPILRERYRVITYDWRGHGRSAESDDYSLPRLVADLGELLERLGAAPATVMGHSMGSAIVSGLAVQRPELVRAVVVVDPPYGAEPQVAAHADVLKGELAGPGCHAAAVGFFDAVGYSPATPPFLRTMVAHRVLATAPAAIAGCFAAGWDDESGIFRRPAADGYLARRACPVLAVHAAPGKADWERTTFRDPRSVALDWRGSGHWIHVERPAELAETVTRWLAGLATAAPDQTSAG